MNISRDKLNQVIELIPSEFETEIHEYPVYKGGIKETHFALIGDFDWEILEKAWKEAGILKKYSPKRRTQIGTEFIYY